jgi:predicted metal-binding protein
MDRPKGHDAGDDEAVEALIRQHGYDDFRWLDPRHIIVAEWVRMKCRFGCVEYGHNACCPPATPSVAECERFFREYRRAVVLHFAKRVDRPEDRHRWTRGVNLGLLKLERALFLAGHRKAFLLFMDSCCICEECAARVAPPRAGAERPTALREACKTARQARPAPEAMAVDVFATVGALGYPIQVLPDYEQEMNRYSFLMVD